LTGEKATGSVLKTIKNSILLGGGFACWYRSSDADNPSISHKLRKMLFCNEISRCIIAGKTRLASSKNNQNCKNLYFNQVVCLAEFI
jgi:hypothetical protein